ncbi:TonB-linked outer membrane protein, SusC/RagA family [Parapedobacter indicus]|uniref:TonB-linked outer membrane protein, SusC/RagA family n=2 Tax=Parapedobacter indicus TaxID=1477437 RepID=A0A1I3FXH1_9SPHI|nr:TonB-linked outer membrane protein, SusC/RagA family [Parapedobacter indicus]
MSYIFKKCLEIEHLVSMFAIHMSYICIKSNALYIMKRLLFYLLLVSGCVHVAFGQRLVTGKVRDTGGNPLVTVTITTDDQAVQTQTDDNGSFKLTVPETSKFLIFSLVGKQEVRSSIGAKETFDIVLEDAQTELDEVVVVGYGTQKRVNLTGSVDQVGSEYFENRPVPSVSRALQGVIPNLNVNQSNGNPTSNPAFNVRGLTSIGAGGEALVLIDGIVGDPAFLNPNDIESVTVLKDAASAAVYGARGAFGVILITTKSSKGSRSQIDYSGAFSSLDRTVKRNLVTDGYRWAKMFAESYAGWYDNASFPATVGASGLLFSQEYLDALKEHSENPGLPEVEVDPATGNYVYYGNTDWEKLLYADGIQGMDHTISFSGANEKLDYMVSGKYYKQDGIYRLADNGFDRYNVRVKGGVQVTDWLKVSSNSNFSNYNYTDPFRGANVFSLLNVNGYGAPMGILYNPDGTLTQQAAGALGISMAGNENQSSRFLFQQDISLAASFLDGKLNIRGDFSYQNTRTQDMTKLVSVPYSRRPGEVIDQNVRQLTKASILQNYFTYNLYGDYQYTIGKHNFKILLGGNLEDNRLENQSVTRDGLLIPELSDLNLAVGQNFTITGGGNQWAIAGVFGRINYNFDEKYLLEVNGRYDGSSKFPKSQQFGFFPSVSAGWRINEESFMDWSDIWLNDLKVRASYGALGNSQIAPYLFVEQLRAAKATYILNGQQPAYIRNPAVIADDFTWETARTFNLGLDAALLDNRLSATFDWYRRETINMITAGPQIPVVFGAAIPTGNYADLHTKGYELSVQWRDQIDMAKPLFYGIRAIFSDNISYITRFNNPLGLITQNDYTFATNFYEGQRYGDLWGYETEGFFTSAEDIASHADQSAVIASGGNIPLPGDVKFKDLNGDGMINKGNRTLDDHGDWTIIGNTTPRYSYGLTADLSWSNFSVSAFFQGIGKRDWYPSYGATEFWGQYTVWYGSLPVHTYENRWTPDNPDAYFPRYKAPMPYGERQLQPQTKYIQNASYVRLKDLTITYRIPQRISERIRLKNAAIYLSGQNIWTYSPMFKLTKDIDPEAITGNPGTGGQHGHAYPMLKTYSIGVNLTL